MCAPPDPEGQEKVAQMEVTLHDASASPITAAGSAVSLRAAIVDENPPVCMALNTTNQTLLVCTERRVRIWDAFTGRQEVMFDRFVPPTTSITTVCVASNGQTFFLGYRDGSVVQYVYSSGTAIKTFREEGPEITQLTYLEGCQSFAVVTSKGCKMYHDKGTESNAFPRWPFGGVQAHFFRSCNVDPCELREEGPAVYVRIAQGRFFA